MSAAAAAQPTLVVANQPRRAREVNTNVKIHCGCGYAATNVPDAERHARDNAHTLTIHGTIRAEL